MYGFLLAASRKQRLQYTGYLNVYGKERVHVTRRLKQLVGDSLHSVTTRHFYSSRQTLILAVRYRIVK